MQSFFVLLSAMLNGMFGKIAVKLGALGGSLGFGAELLGIDVIAQAGLAPEIGGAFGMLFLLVAGLMGVQIAQAAAER